MASARPSRKQRATHGSTDAASAGPVGSRRVRKILRLEARARRLLARYDQALTSATRAMAQARALFDDAEGLEGSLTGTELGALRRGRPEIAEAGIAPRSRPPDRPSTTTSR